MPHARETTRALCTLALCWVGVGIAHAQCPADLDQSGSVDGSDLATLLGGWATSGTVADIDASGLVDGADLTILLSGWGQCPALAPERMLVTRLTSMTTDLLDESGSIVQSWTGAANGASIGYLRPDGSLVRPALHAAGAYTGAARGGRIQVFSPAGTLVNDLLVSTSEYQQHHDICLMPNGNILCIAWEGHTQAQGLAAGRTGLTGIICPETILEIQPTGFSTFTVVWRWSLWNHLIQGVNSSLANFGVVADHPELVNINYASVAAGGDWIHANSIDYDAGRDEIVISSRTFNELWVIDHSTTTAQAATHVGGRSGRGGDILYRWGNPAAYGRGTSANQYYFGVHSATWIDEGLPGAGNILTFNNGDRAGTVNDYSTVVEINPPRDEAGGYLITSGSAFGPAAPAWTYGAAGAFYGGPTQCGAFRTNDNTTLITLTNSGTVFEVTNAGQTVREFAVTGQVARVPRYRLVDGVWVGP